MNSFGKRWKYASRSISQKFGDGSTTGLDDQYLTIEKQVDSTLKFLRDVEKKLSNYVTPDKTARLRTNAMNILAKIQGAEKSSYPHPEYDLANCFKSHSSSVGHELRTALDKTGDAIFKLASLKAQLEQALSSGYMFATKSDRNSDETKELQYSRKLLQKNRVECDMMKAKNEDCSYSDQQIEDAASRLTRRKAHTEESMRRFLYRDPDRIKDLCKLAYSLRLYHSECAKVVNELHFSLRDASNKCVSYSSIEDLMPIGPERLGLMSAVSSSTKNYGSESMGLRDNNSLTTMTERMVGAFASPRRLNCEFSPDRWAWSEVTSDRNRKDSFQTERITLLAASRCSQKKFENDEKSKKNVPMPKNWSNQERTCVATFSFIPANERELALKAGDVVKVRRKVDEQWLEGENNDMVGIFPANYVKYL